jgi:hypothetical protein
MLVRASQANRVDQISNPPILIYDKSKQKLVLIFRTVRCAASYLFNNVQKSGLVCSGIAYKSRNSNNIFQKEIVFRNGKEEHITLLGENDYLVLDDDYLRDKLLVSLKSGMFDKRK